MAANELLLSVRNLKRYFDIGKRQTLKAVDDVSFDIGKGETFGLVGESGCGKSTLARTVIRLYQATAGTVLFDGIDVHGKMAASESHNLTRRMQMIFQDPYASLNQRMKVMDIVAEGIDAHGLARDGEERARKVAELLETVGLSEEHAGRFPHEFSGGQRQRIGIARALAVDPDFIIADEPISALDVSIQAQVINLMQELQEKRGLTYLFIAHDLSMVRHISDRVGVMYLGRMAESATSEELFARPLHPYTQGLLSSIPLPDPDCERSRPHTVIEGSLPNPIDLPRGCLFRTRCRKAVARCGDEPPALREVESGHSVACHLLD